MADRNPYSTPRSLRATVAGRQSRWLRTCFRVREAAAGALRLALTVSFIGFGTAVFAGALVGEPSYWVPGLLAGFACGVPAWMFDTLWLLFRPSRFRIQLQENH